MKAQTRVAIEPDQTVSPSAFHDTDTQDLDKAASDSSPEAPEYMGEGGENGRFDQTEDFFHEKQAIQSRRDAHKPIP